MVEILNDVEERTKRLTKFAREVKIKEIIRPLNNKEGYTNNVFCD